MLKNQIELSADPAKTLIEFLSSQESLLKRISSYDKEDAKQALNKVYRLIADFGGKVRERKGDRELVNTGNPRSYPPRSHVVDISRFIRQHRFATPR